MEEVDNEIKPYSPKKMLVNYVVIDALKTEATFFSFAVTNSESEIVIFLKQSREQKKIVGCNENYCPTRYYYLMTCMQIILLKDTSVINTLDNIAKNEAPNYNRTGMLISIHPIILQRIPYHEQQGTVTYFNYPNNISVKALK